MPGIDQIDLPGRVLLPDGTERECLIRFDEADRIEIALDAAPPAGTRVLCHVPCLGAVDGVIVEKTPAGHRLDVRATPRHAARLAGRMAWHRRMAGGREDQRGHGRIVPLRAEVGVRLASGSELAGTLLDLSATGAALRLPVRPDVGARIVVGRRHATVVRQLDGGVAVAFALPLRPQDVTPETVL